MTSKKINVCVKIRPVLETLIIKKKRQWRIENNKSVLQIDSPNIKFLFDHVYAENSSNKEIFDDYGKPIVQSALNGINGTIFVYGPKLSGKTYSIHGDQNDPGIIYLASKELFNLIEKTTDKVFLVRIGYFEIYNENIYDLFNNKKLCKFNLNERDNVNVECKEYAVDSLEKLIERFMDGTSQRRLYKQSNISHNIFRIIIESQSNKELSENDNSVLTSILHFVDLTEHSDEMKLNSITKKKNKNYSLASLTNLVHQLSEHAHCINYRDSKLTRILQASLGGNCETVAICTINPMQTKDTYVTLNFGSQLRSIINKPIVNEDCSERLFTKRLKKDIIILYENLENAILKNNQADVDRLKEKLNLIESQFIPFKDKMLSNTNQCLHLDLVPLSDEKHKSYDIKKEIKDNELIQIKTPSAFKFKKQILNESLDTNSLLLKYNALKNELKELKDFTRLENNINCEINENTDEMHKNDKLKNELAATKNDLFLLKNKNQELKEDNEKFKNEITMEKKLQTEKFMTYIKTLQNSLNDLFLSISAGGNCNDTFIEKIQLINNLLENCMEFNLDSIIDRNSLIKSKLETPNAYLLQIKNKDLLNKIDDANKQIESFEDQLNTERNNFDKDFKSMQVELSEIVKENANLKQELIKWVGKYNAIEMQSIEMAKTVEELVKSKNEIEKTKTIVEGELKTTLEGDMFKLNELQTKLSEMEITIAEERFSMDKKFKEMKNELNAENTNFEEYQRRQESINNYKDEEINALKTENELLTNSLASKTDKYEILKASMNKFEIMCKEELKLNDNESLEQIFDNIIKENRKYKNQINLLNENIEKLNMEKTKVNLVTELKCLQTNNNNNKNIQVNSPKQKDYNKENRLEIYKLLGENNDLKQKNNHLTIEMNDLRRTINNDRKSRRQSAHDEKRQLWDYCDVGLMTDPTNETCSCQDMNKKINELKRVVIVKDAHISTIHHMYNNNSLQEEIKEMKKTLITVERTMEEVRRDNAVLRKQNCNLNEKHQKMKKTISLLKERAAQIEDENNQIEVLQSELTEYKNKYFRLNNILKCKNSQETVCVPQEKENAELQEKYNMVKVICLKRKQKIELLENELKFK